MMQPLGPFFSAKAFAPRSFSAWLYVPFPLIVHAIKPVAYALVGDNWPLGSWWHVHKTLVHPTPTPTPTPTPSAQRVLDDAGDGDDHLADGFVR